MARNTTTSESIDKLLICLMTGSVTATMLVAPNAIQVLGKPLDKIFRGLDDRRRQRELSRLKSYLKTQGLVRGDYDHGITLTKKAKRRIEKYKFESLEIHKLDCWDGKWRLVLFDIPESQREERVYLTNKIQELGFQLLQQSVWIHPFADREIIATITEYYGISRWVTFIETEHIDNSVELERRFNKILN